MSGQLEGRVAIVTGAGGGLGRGISLAFAREGAAIVVADRDDEKGAETLRALCGLGARAAYLHVDVTNPELVRALVDSTQRQFGTVHVLVNNAGIDTTSAVAEMHSSCGARRLRSTSPAYSSARKRCCLS